MPEGQLSACVLHASKLVFRERATTRSGQPRSKFQRKARSADAASHRPCAVYDPCRRWQHRPHRRQVRRCSSSPHPRSQEPSVTRDRVRGHPIAQVAPRLPALKIHSYGVGLYPGRSPNPGGRDLHHAASFSGSRPRRSTSSPAPTTRPDVPASAPGTSSRPRNRATSTGPGRTSCATGEAVKPNRA